jgi:hypothetical protein
MLWGAVRTGLSISIWEIVVVRVVFPTGRSIFYFSLYIHKTNQPTNQKDSMIQDFTLIHFWCKVFATRLLGPTQELREH